MTSEQFQGILGNFRAISEQFRSSWNRFNHLDRLINFRAVLELFRRNSELNIPRNEIDLNLNEGGKELAFDLKKRKRMKKKRKREKNKKQKASQMWKGAKKNFTEIGFPFGHIFVIASFLTPLLFAGSFSSRIHPLCSVLPSFSLSLSFSSSSPPSPPPPSSPSISNPKKMEQLSLFLSAFLPLPPSPRSFPSYEFGANFGFYFRYYTVAKFLLIRNRSHMSPSTGLLNMINN